MKDERSIRSARTSRITSGSQRYFDFLESSHSVFSKHSYYTDKSSIHPWLRQPFSRYSGIAYSTLNAGPCSKRTEELARPKIKRERMIRHEIFDNVTNYAYSGVKSTALIAQCSERVAKLAQPKGMPVGFFPGYDLPRAVPESALQAHLSKRIEELAKPKYNRLTYTQSLWYPKQKS